MVNKQDQWIEVWNTLTRTVDVGGWILDTGGNSAIRYRIPAKTNLQPGAFLVLFRRQSGLELDDSGGTVRLLDPSGVLLDSATYVHLGPDASYSRDTSGNWHSDWPPSPGRPNLAPLPALSPRRAWPVER